MGFSKYDQIKHQVNGHDNIENFKPEKKLMLVKKA